MIQLVLALIAIYLYFLLVQWFFRVPAPYVFALGCVLTMIAILVNYVRSVVHVLGPDQPVVDAPAGPEPAFRQYFLGKVLPDYREIVVHSVKLNRDIGRWVIKAGTVLFANPGFLLTWPLGVIFFLIAGVSAVAGAAAYAVLGLIHLAIVIVSCGIMLATGLLFWTIESLLALVRGIFITCPHAGCYRRIALPVYVCPSCGAFHRRLVPGRYGTFRRRCKCGRKLPTLLLFGRNRLPSLCPHTNCGRPLTEAAGTVPPVFFPIVGGPATGKTSLLMACVAEMQRFASGGELRLGFPDEMHERLFESCRDAFEHGAAVLKTTELAPDAFVVQLQNRMDGGRLMHVYDAAGELFQDSGQLHGHEYYSYINGLMFVVDPFSLDQIRSEIRSAGVPGLALSTEAPQFVYDRMVQQLRNHLGSKVQAHRLPIAVVVTKVDAMDIEGRIAGAADPTARGGRGSTESGSVRAWLCANGEGNLVRSIENDFRRIRYFHCSALGRVPGADTTPFKPRGVLKPLGWLLDGSHFHGLPGSPPLGLMGQAVRIGRIVSAPVAAAAMLVALLAGGFALGAFVTSHLGVVDVDAPAQYQIEVGDSQGRVVARGGSTARFGLGDSWFTRGLAPMLEPILRGTGAHAWALVRPGSYTVRLDQFGQPVGRETVQVAGWRRVTLDPARMINYATWTVQSKPPAELSVDGNVLGTTPLTVERIPPGSHVLVLSARGRRTLREHVDVPPGASQMIRRVLRPGRDRGTPPEVAYQAHAPGTFVVKPYGGGGSGTVPRAAVPWAVAAQAQEMTGRIVRARITNVDDIAILFVNGQEAMRTRWGRGAGDAAIGHAPGETGWKDISDKFHAGDNRVRMWVKNESGCCGVSGTFDLTIDGVAIIHHAFAEQNSTSGVKLDRTMVIPISAPTSHAAMATAVARTDHASIAAGAAVPAVSPGEVAVTGASGTPSSTENTSMPADGGEAPSEPPASESAPAAPGEEAESEVLIIPATRPIIVKTKPLEAGVTYTLEASGTFDPWGKTPHAADAIRCFGWPRCRGKEAKVAQELLVDGRGLVSLSGGALAYNESHVYRVTVVGQGRPVAIWIRDALSSYRDNVGAITVRVIPNR